MTKKFAKYRCKKRITDPKVFKKATERMNDPDIVTGKEGVYHLFKLMGIPIKWNDIFSD